MSNTNNKQVLKNQRRTLRAANNILTKQGMYSKTVESAVIELSKQIARAEREHIVKYVQTWANSAALNDELFIDDIKRALK